MATKRKYGEEQFEAVILQRAFGCTSPEWVYKRPVSVDGKSSMWFFDKYSCMRVFDEGYEKQKAKMRSENAKLQHKRQKQEAAGRRRADGEA